MARFILDGKKSCRHILILAVSISAIFHILLLASPDFLHLPPMSPQQPDADISIELRTSARTPPASSRESGSGAVDPENEVPPAEPTRAANRPEQKKKRAPAPAPRKTPRMKSQKATQNAKAGPEGEKDLKAVPAAEPARGETRRPRPAGGAFSPQPAYPDLARKRGQEGVVSIRCQVDSSGKVINAAIAKSSGFRLLDEAALKTLRQWKFAPGLKNGAPIAGSVVVPVRFQLR